MVPFGNLSSFVDFEKMLRRCAHFLALNISQKHNRNLQIALLLCQAMNNERVALETLRHQYVVSFAGFYGGFRGMKLVGIEEDVLKKMDLVPYIDRITVSKFEEKNKMPAFLKEHLTVVPVSEEEFDIDESLLQQELGLAVLPDDVSICRKLEIGDRIVLNAVLSRKMLMWGKGQVRNKRLKNNRR